MRTLTLLAALILTAAAQDNPAIPVVKASIEAHGGAEALTAARTARMTGAGSLFQSGQEIKFVAQFAYVLPEKYKIDLIAEAGGAKMTASQVLNGGKVKITHKVDGKEAAIDSKLKEETKQSGLYEEIRSLTPLLDKKYTMKLEKDADLNGNAASVITVSGNGLKDVKLFFDKKSNRLVKTQRRGLGRDSKGSGVIEVDEEVYFSDFKPFGKATLPAAMMVNHDGKKFMSMNVSEWKFVEKIEDKEFATE